VPLSLLTIAGLVLAASPGDAQQAEQTRTTAPRHVAVEIFVRAGDPGQQTAIETARQFLADRGGAALRVVDLDADQAGALERLEQLAAHYRFPTTELPILYGCNQIIQGETSKEGLQRRLAEMLRIVVYVRTGCPRCANAKAFLGDLAKRYPPFEIRFRDIATDAVARTDLQQVVRRYNQAAASVPVFHFCDQMLVGFDAPATTGKRLEAILEYWTYPAPAKAPAENSDAAKTSAAPLSGHPRDGPLTRLVGFRPHGLPAFGPMAAAMLPSGDAAPPPPPLPPPPAGAQQERVAEERPPPSRVPPLDPETMPLPWIGEISADEWGMPLFTVIVGLVDGFNPCAMWVLLFLLSILVNLRNRLRILAVAGTFVVISGLAYFAFMAAWLNVFLVVGYLRPIQITLALLAIAVGSVHVKDFFAFQRGVSLSIPDSAKPGIYARVRRIVNAENLTAAIIGAAVLAVLVNVIELLCTAGLPALYTQILTMQELPAWKNYAYLALYNLAYMFDDGLMVGVVVATLGKRQLQERQGRWLKLVSGLVILLLGLVMLFHPEWLM